MNATKTSQIHHFNKCHQKSVSYITLINATKKSVRYITLINATKNQTDISL